MACVHVHSKVLSSWVYFLVSVKDTVGR